MSFKESLAEIEIRVLRINGELKKANKLLKDNSALFATEKIEIRPITLALNGIETNAEAIKRNSQNRELRGFLASNSENLSNFVNKLAAIIKQANETNFWDPDIKEVYEQLEKRYKKIKKHYLDLIILIKELKTKLALK